MLIRLLGIIFSLTVMLFFWRIYQNSQPTVMVQDARTNAQDTDGRIVLNEYLVLMEEGAHAHLEATSEASAE